MTIGTHPGFSGAELPAAKPEKVVVAVSSKTKSFNQYNLLIEVLTERQRQDTLNHSGTGTSVFDQDNSRNDWVAYIAAYVGRAGDKVRRNEKEAQSFRENMIKVAALALAAVESFDTGNC